MASDVGPVIDGLLRECERLERDNAKLRALLREAQDALMNLCAANLASCRRRGKKMIAEIREELGPR